MTERLLEIRDLHVTYATSEGPLPAVRGVDLTVERGAIVGVAGESGCGKSTLASTVLRLQAPDATVSGQVLFDGRDVLTMGWGELRAVRWAGASIVFQGALHSLNPVHRIGAQIAEAIHVHNPGMAESIVTSRIRGLLEQVGLDPDRARSYPHQLSGGQKQRVAIAAAIAAGPKLLIADEATSALDTIVQAEIVALIRRLVTEDGMTLLFISHDIALAAELAERIAVFRHGQLVELGTAAQIVGAPTQPYTRALLDAHIGLDAEPLLNQAGLHA
jgi:peptide/nickel transport system ATP-binding protein